MVDYIKGADDWILKRGFIVLGHLIYEDTSQPFFYFKFHPEPAYCSVQQLFSEEVRLMDQSEEEWIEAGEKIYQLGLTLVSMTEQTEVDDFLIHIDGELAWLRL